MKAGKIELVIERTSLPLILEETTTLIKERAARRNVYIKKELSSELEFIELDKQRFKQINPEISGKYGQGRRFTFIFPSKEIKVEQK